MNKENDPYWFEHDPFIDDLGGQPPDWYWDYPNIERLNDEIPTGNTTASHQLYETDDGSSADPEVYPEQPLE